MSIKLVLELKERVSKLNYKERLKDYPELLAQCDGIFDAYVPIAQQMEDLSPAVEQLRGIVRGLTLAQHAVIQHKDMYLNKAKEKEITKEEFLDKREIIEECAYSVRDALKDHESKFFNVASKVDGFGVAANNLISQVEKRLGSLDRQARFMEDDNPREVIVEEKKSKKTKRARRNGSKAKPALA